MSPEADALLGALLTRCPQLRPGETVDCAVSGGPDSMALLALAATAGCRVTAVHVDHGLRQGSAAEAGLVAVAARRFGAAFRAETVTVAGGPNLEARARDARHAVLGPDALTGHTADDQAETMLLNLLRGGSLNGLAGMRPHRHPLLGLRRHETHSLCRALDIEVVDDPSNRSPVHLRNRVRAELLPLMDALATRDLAPVLARQAGVWRDDADLLDVLAADIEPTDAKALAAAPVALARRAVRGWLTTDHPPDLATIERVLAVARGECVACQTGDGRSVMRRHQRLWLDGPFARLAWPADVLLCPRLRPPLVRGALMPPRLRGKWALGITPRNFTWVLKDKLAVCERPGGYGDNHRRVRRQEEIIWIRENGFGCLISIIPAPHNLHNYEELGVNYRHRPFTGDDLGPWLKSFYTELKGLLDAGTKVIVHNEEVGDKIIGIMGGYIRWSGLVEDSSQAIMITERIAERQLDPFAREVILMAHTLR